MEIAINTLLVLGALIVLTLIFFLAYIQENKEKFEKQGLIKIGPQEMKPWEMKSNPSRAW